MAVERGTFNFKTHDTESIEQVFVYQTGNPLTPVDLTSAQFRMEIRDGGADGTLLLQLTTVNGKIVIDPDQVANTGQFTVIISLTDMAAILTAAGVESGTFDYDIRFISASGTQGKVLFGGDFVVEKSVTRI